MVEKKLKMPNIDDKELKLPENDLNYDEWLEFFRQQPAGLLSKYERLKNTIPTEGYAALKRWQEIIENPSKMDKLYQGRLKAQNDKNIMKVAVGDDDEEFYEALIRENVQQLNSSNVSAQEAARLTQNLNIFRQQLREIRSRKPKKGTVLEKVLEKADLPVKPAKKKASKTTSKAGTKKKTSNKSSGKGKGK